MTPLQTILNGSLGALTFGMWWHYVSMRQIEEYNKNKGVPPLKPKKEVKEEYTSWW
jgi:hypothetical protein